jgi:hypothetical protein
MRAVWSLVCMSKSQDDDKHDDVYVKVTISNNNMII